MLFKSFSNNSSNEVRSISLENPSISLTDPRAWSGGSGISFTGEEITPATALGIPAVWACVDFISNEVSSLPWQVFKKNKDQRVKSVTDPLYQILHDFANPRTTSFMFRKSMMVNVLTIGRAFAYIEKNKMGRVMNLWILDPNKVRITVNAQFELVYHYQPPNGAAVVYQQDEIIDLAWMPGPDGVSHISPTDRLKNALGLSVGAERYASKTFQNGGVAPLKLVGNFNSPVSAERAASDIQNAMRMARDNQRSVVVVPKDFQLEPIGFDAAKNQLLELRRFQVEEIARMYGLPPTSIQDFTKASFSNVEQADINVAKHCIMHWVNRWEEEVNLKLFGKNVGQRFAEMNMDGMLRGDFESRMRGYQSAINSAIFKPNEVRALENLPPEDFGDQLFIQSGTLPIAGLQGTNPQNAPVEDTPNPAVDPDDNDDIAE